MIKFLLILLGILYGSRLLLRWFIMNTLNRNQHQNTKHTSKKEGEVTIVNKSSAPHSHPQEQKGEYVNYEEV